MLTAMKEGQRIYQLPEMEMRKLIDRFKNSPSEYDAFRAGVSQAMLERLRAGGATADPLATVFPRGVEDKLRRAFRDDEAFDAFKTRLAEERGIILYALGLTPHVRESFAPLAYYTGGEYFAVGGGENAIEAIRTVLVAEFADLAFDQRVLERCARDPDWTVDALCEVLESSCGQVSASINRDSGFSRTSLLI